MGVDLEAKPKEWEVTLGEENDEEADEDKKADEPEDDEIPEDKPVDDDPDSPKEDL